METTQKVIEVVGVRFNINIHEAVDQVWDAIEVLFPRETQAIIEKTGRVTEAQFTAIYQHINNELTVNN